MNNLRAYLACIFIVCAWSGWITISRFGVHSNLQPADITLIRYVTALLCVLPLVLRHQWPRYKLHQYLIMALGIGFPYTMATFYGLKVLKAAHAGVLVNGMLPVLGALAAWIILKQRVSILRYAAIALIFVANFVMAGCDTFSLDHSVGILLLLSAAACYTSHMVAVRLWHFQWRDVLVAVPVVNTVLFLPLWFFFPTSLKTAPLGEIFSQAVYQGVIVNIIALMFSTYAIARIGTITVSIFMSFVPVGTAILAWLLLGESLNGWELCGITGCSAGLFFYAWGQILETRGRPLK
jgi:drug/metabolite transporter (DMT)-like permease